MTSCVGPDAARLRTWLEAERRRVGVPALAGLVVEGPQQARLAVVGTADPASGRPVTDDTVFAWFSLTKVVTASLLVQLAEAGLVDLDAPVVDTLPQVAGLAAPAGGPPMTARHLLGHRAGLRDRQWHAVRWFGPPAGPEPDPHALFVEVVRRRPRRRRAGARFHYSNLGYAILGELVARVTGTSFREALHARVLRPLGMARTDFRLSPPLATDAAVGTMRRGSALAWAVRLLGDGAFVTGRHGRYELVAPRPLVFSPHGGLHGPLADLARFLGAHIGRGTRGDVVLLSPQGVAAMGREHGVCGRGQRAGLGWCLTSADPPVLYHGGRGPGFTTEMQLDRARGRAYALLGNGAFDARRSTERLRAWDGESLRP